jgi:hypothetical protein
LRKCSEKKIEKNQKKNVLVYRRPEDEAISLFAGLLANPDVPLSLDERLNGATSSPAAWNQD